MELTESIKALIDNLNPDDDLFLIDLLKDKLNSIKISEQTFTVNEIGHAKQALNSMFKHLTYKQITENEDYIKACYEYKLFSDELESMSDEHYTENEEALEQKRSKIYDKIDNIRSLVEKDIRLKSKALLTDDVVNLKALIMKIQNKIKNKK